MLLVIAFALAAICTPVMGAIGVRLGIVDRPGPLKIHDRPVPVVGGPALAVAVIVALTVTGHGDPWIAGAVVLGVVGGSVDDIRPLPAWVRLGAQAAAGGLLIAGGLRLEPLGAPGAAGMVIATMACCNAVNMLDGQDGLASGLGVCAALGIAGVLASSGLAAELPLALAAALLGFLVWNRPPARVFLGDGGAYAVGVLLAASAGQASDAGWPGLFAAGACLGVFAYELVSTIVRRVAYSAPAVRGDRNHSYDRLTVRLGSRTRSTLAIWVLGAASSAIGIVLVRMGPVPGIVLVLAIVALTGLLDVRLIPASLAKEDR
jgi:UDP-N-acetylmuramyl pentapeptide phosphotransferase/UDP-N-acetylglucosamine-1-phosphate transferase